MSSITTRLHNKALKQVNPVVEELARSGMESRDIAVQVKKYVQVKIDQYYRQHEFDGSRMANVISNLLPSIKSSETADSKAESIFLAVLEENKIPFKFQYQIGRYRVDFLISGSIVFEGDGPHHKHQKSYDQARDRYLEKMGYKVIRLTWDIVAQVQDDVICEIKNLIKELKL